MEIKNMFRFLSMFICMTGCVMYYEIVPLGGWSPAITVMFTMVIGVTAIMNLVFLITDLWQGDRKQNEKHTERSIHTTISRNALGQQ